MRSRYFGLLDLFDGHTFGCRRADQCAVRNAESFHQPCALAPTGKALWTLWPLGGEDVVEDGQGTLEPRASRRPTSS
jgi:hypothetical protein